MTKSIVHRSNKRMEYNVSNYSKIKEIILKLNSNELLKGKLYIVGGTVPYIISNTISNREHSDIDIIVEEKNMNTIREYLQSNNLYDRKLDSLTFEYNKDKVDYGVDCFIDGITVNFAPFKLINNGMLQRNFLSKQNSGINALVNVPMENIKLEDCITIHFVDQVQLKTYNLEMIKIMKEKSKKPKDQVDIKVIDEHGYNKEKYEELKVKTNNMKFNIYPKSRILRFFFNK